MAWVLTLPASETRESLLVITYLIVIFSMVVQGLTQKKRILRE